MGVSPYLQRGGRSSGLGLLETSEGTPPFSCYLDCLWQCDFRGKDKTDEASGNPISPREENHGRRGREKKAK